MLFDYFFNVGEIKLRLLGVLILKLEFLCKGFLCIVIELLIVLEFVFGVLGFIILLVVLGILGILLIWLFGFFVWLLFKLFIFLMV